LAAKNPLSLLPDGVVKANLPEFFKSYPSLCAASPSSWFAWSIDEKKVIAHNNHVCHANLCYDGPGFDELITAVPYSDELSLEYIRMLIRGPFRSVSDLIRLERLGNKYFLRCLNLDRWPGNVLMNFCIATRVTIEHRFILEPWGERCEKGFDPVLAFLLTYSYGSSRGYNGCACIIGTHRSFDHWRTAHFWLDPSSNWSNILQGNMVGLSKSFKIAPEDSRPTNCIWGVCKDYIKLKAMTDDEIAAFYTMPVQKLEAPEPMPLSKTAPKKKPVPFLYQFPAGQFNPNIWPQPMPQFNAQLQQPIHDEEPIPNELEEQPDIDDFDDEPDPEWN